LLADLLAACGHEVRTAKDAASALAVVGSYQPEVALLDIGLPVMDGYALAQRLRALLGPKTPRLIALTGYGQRDDRERARRAGFDEHLVKPIDADRLLQTIVA
jgi:CheY-like chemotaxis protein